MKEYAPACERNKDFIFQVLREALPEKGFVLEIGSGTGQHAAWFAEHLPDLIWQPTDQPGMLDSIEAWRLDTGLTNFNSPLALDLFDDNWPIETADAIVCINTIHIVSMEAVKNLFTGVGRVLASTGVLYVYGPYRYSDRPLEPSNENFDRWLKMRDPLSGVRDFDTINALAEENGLKLVEDRAMPANNRSIWFRKGV